MLDTWLVCNGHKGVNQQGNKSLLSFRTGYGQPGYTGYIPAIDAIPYSVKDETKRLPPGRPRQRDAGRPFTNPNPRLPPVGAFRGTTNDHDLFLTVPELPKKLAGRRGDPDASSNGGHWMGQAFRPKHNPSGIPPWARAATCPNATFRTSSQSEMYPKKEYSNSRSGKMNWTGVKGLAA